MAELTLHNGDCLEVMKAIPDKSIDLIICDLPYGCLASPKGNPAHQRAADNGGQPNGCAWDIKINLEQFWKQVKRIRKSDHSPTIHFCTTKFGFDLIQSNPDEFRYDLVWDKQRGVSFLSANKMPMRSHEMIYIFSKAGAFYERKDFTGDFKGWKGHGTRFANITDRMEGSGGEGTRCVLSVVNPPQYMNFKKWNVKIDRKINTQTYNGQVPIAPTNSEGGDGKCCVLSVIPNPTSVKKGGHPTEKPEALYRFLIERYCPAGGTVLDPTFGSGNSVFTAFALGRTAIGIEKDEAFFKKAEERLNALP